MMNYFNLFAGLFSIVGGLISIFLFRTTHPLMALASTLLIFLGTVFVLYRHYGRSFFQVRRGLAIICKGLLQKNFHPDSVIAFNRSGSVVAGMLAVNVGIQEVLSLCRRREETVTRQSTERRKFKVGVLMTLDAAELKRRNLLVVFLLIDTGNTLDEGLQYLHDLGITNVEIATIYISPGAKNRWPNIVFAYETSDGRGVLKRLPWVLDEYHYV